MVSHRRRAHRRASWVIAILFELLRCIPRDADGVAKKARFPLLFTIELLAPERPLTSAQFFVGALIVSASFLRQSLVPISYIHIQLITVDYGASLVSPVSLWAFSYETPFARMTII